MSSIKEAFLADHKFRALIGVRILLKDEEIGRGEWILIEINPRFDKHVIINFITSLD